MNTVYGMINVRMRRPTLNTHAKVYERKKTGKS